ncbi:hypothetical protein GCM10007874_17600 [Labrys miyagiensis]|uniref:C-type lysozyme inhibitor domain-containing protein n=1 Tax=Labrys miyagiensis TaxID=346912 RepID=A0ABQ6CGC9_9HYPH|nr:hypothetical protein [Labrys miyagiensis]GLS18743.1 hypothetical protein GCM10007874_17600 [Labrys miyagiensis]
MLRCFVLAAMASLIGTSTIAGEVWVCHGKHELKVIWDKSKPSITVDGHLFQMQMNQYSKVSAVMTGNGIRYQHYGNKMNPGLGYNELTMAGATETYHCKPGT